MLLVLISVCSAYTHFLLSHSESTAVFSCDVLVSRTVDPITYFPLLPSNPPIQPPNTVLASSSALSLVHTVAPSPSSPNGIPLCPVVVLIFVRDMA